MDIFEKYEQVVKYSGFKIFPRMFISIGAAIIMVGAAVYLITKNFLILILGLALGDAVIAIPYMMGRKKIDEVEENLSDALRQMASVLRSGGTFEVAVREIAASDYGQLSKEFTRIMREMEGGKTFVAALQGMARRVDSDLLRKVTIIISDAVRTGGKVADILEEIAEDVRKFRQLRKERKARTTMQFFFIIAVAVALGPFMMGVSVGIATFMLNMGKYFASMGMKGVNLAGAEAAVKFTERTLTMFLIIQSVAAAVMAAIIREGRATKGFVYAPIFMVIGYLIFIGGKAAVLALTAGALG